MMARIKRSLFHEFSPLEELIRAFADLSSVASGFNPFSITSRIESLSKIIRRYIRNNNSTCPLVPFDAPSSRRIYDDI